MNIRKVAPIAFTSLMALANLHGNIASMSVFIACGTSLAPCVPSKNDLTFSNDLRFQSQYCPSAAGISAS